MIQFVEMMVDHILVNAVSEKKPVSRIKRSKLLIRDSVVVVNISIVSTMQPVKVIHLALDDVFAQKIA